MQSTRQEDAVLRSWQKNPDFYSSGITQSVFTLIEREFAPPEQRLRSLIAGERAMPQVLAEARRNLSNPPKVFTEIALDQLPPAARRILPTCTTRSASSRSRSCAPTSRPTRVPRSACKGSTTTSCARTGRRSRSCAGRCWATTRRRYSRSGHRAVVPSCLPALNGWRRCASRGSAICRPRPRAPRARRSRRDPNRAPCRRRRTPSGSSSGSGNDSRSRRARAR